MGLAGWQTCSVFVGVSSARLVTTAGFKPAPFRGRVVLQQLTSFAFSQYPRLKRLRSLLHCCHRCCVHLCRLPLAWPLSHCPPPSSCLCPAAHKARSLTTRPSGTGEACTRVCCTLYLYPEGRAPWTGVAVCVQHACGHSVHTCMSMYPAVYGPVAHSSYCSWQLYAGDSPGLALGRGPAGLHVHTCILHHLFAPSWLLCAERLLFSTCCRAVSLTFGCVCLQVHVCVRGLRSVGWSGYRSAD